MNDTKRRRERTDRPRDDAYEHTRRDASAGWRAEYHFQGAAQAARTDGGRFQLPEPGDRVRDRDGGDELYVVGVHPDTAATDHRVEALDKTVAAANRAYDPDAPVVEAVYAEDLDHTRGVEDVRDSILAADLKSYSFPADRLTADLGGETA
jgi:hypothetical protein